MDPLTAIIIVLIVIVSAVVHEVAHGYAALWMGDTTAYYAGRLTLNPIKHLDFVGSIIIPLLLSFSGIVFGWAKPVPYNPYNLKNRRWGELAVAIAGPISNIVIAVVFGIFIRLILGGTTEVTSLVFIASLIVQVNLVLAIFNLIPIPPLDGSKILFALIPNQTRKFRDTFERYGFVFVIIFVFFLWQLFTPFVDLFFKLITGVSF